MTLAERFDAWAQEYEEKGLKKGIQEGIEKGIEKGEALVLQRLLSKRFGPLSPQNIHAIPTASTEQIETWLDRLFDASSADEVLRA